MTTSEKIGASIVVLFVLNVIALYCAFAGGASWGSEGMGFVVGFANLVAVITIGAMWLGVERAK